MLEISSGYYATNFTPNNTGLYPSTIQCAFNGQTAIADLTFTAERGVSTFMGFEIAIPLVMLTISIASIAGFFAYKKERPTLTDETVRHGLLIMCFVFFLVSIIAVKHLTDFENSNNNATLTNLSNLVEKVYIGVLWITVGLIMWAGISLVMKGAVLIKSQALEKKKKDEELFQDFHPDEGDS
jgi:hypothetical protein